MVQMVQPPTTSTVHGTVSDSIPALPIVESGTTSSQSNSCVPPSSIYSSDPESNNAMLLDNVNVCQEDTVASDGMAPYDFDPLSPLISLPQTTDLLPQSSNLLSQEVSQSTSMSVDTLQSPTSTAHGAVSVSLPAESSTTTLSLSNSCVLPSSTYPSDPELKDAMHTLTKCSQENSETSDGMEPYIFDLFFPLIPLSQNTDLLPQGKSQFASKEQGVDTFQPSKSTAHSHHSMSSSNLPSSPALPPSTDSSPKLRSVNSKNSSREKMAFETEWIHSFDLFSLFPLPESVDLLSQGMSQPTSMEQRVQPPTSSAHGTVSDHLPALPIVESNTTLSQSNSCVPPSSTYSSDPELNRAPRTLMVDETCGQESRETSDGVDPYIFDLLFQIPLIPQTTNLLPQESPQSASKEQRVDTLQPIPSTAHSQPSTLDGSCTTEKMVSEMEPIFDLFSLIPLPQTTNLLPQEVSQSASREQGVDTLQPLTTTAPPHRLPVDQTTNIQREMGTPSPCSHSSVHEDKGNNASVCTHISLDPSHSLEESLCIQETLGEQSMASSISSASPSIETASQMEAESNVEAQDCMNRKGKPKKAISVIQQQRQRRLNKVSALHYRQRKKEQVSDLEVRKEQLEVENARLKEQVSVLTTEIAKLKTLSKTQKVSKTQKAKFCPFFLHSTCIKFK